MKEILENLSKLISLIEKDEIRSYDNLIAFANGLKAIKKDLEKYDKQEMVNLNINYSKPTITDIHKIKEVLSIKPPKLPLEKRIELLKQSKEKPTTGGYNESELRSLQGNIFVIPKDYDYKIHNELFINKQSGEFYTNQGGVFFPIYSKSVRYIAENYTISFRLPTKREKSIFREFYPEYRTEPEKLDLSTLKVGDFVVPDIFNYIFEVTNNDVKNELLIMLNSKVNVEHHLYYKHNIKTRLATEPEISNYINRPIDVDSLKVGDLLYWKLENIIKVDKIKNEWLYIESLGKNDFQPYHLKEISKYFRYPTQKEISDYLAEQKPKPESLEIVNPEVGMLVVDKANNKIRKIRSIEYDSNDKIMYCSLSVKSGVYLSDFKALSVKFRLPTETELKEYNEKQERKQVKKNKLRNAK